MTHMDLVVVDLTRELVRSESPTGRESPAARAYAQALTELGFDEVVLDGAGNVVGELRRGEGPTVLLNGHIDTVPAGDPAAWPHPPFEGVLDGGRVFGRGACDMKGALAAMAVGARRAADDDVSGRIVVSAVVQEEVCGLGARYLASTQRADVVILGEPSDLRLMLGHRGRTEVRARFPGRLAHAARAELGENALSRAAHFVTRLDLLDLPSDARLGRSSATATSLVTWPAGGTNVVPGSAELVIDYRSVPGETLQDVLERLRALDPGAELGVPEELFHSEDGEVAMTLARGNPSYLLAEDHPAVATALEALRGALASPVEADTWWFATDAPHLSALGAPVLGFGPGDPELAHTSHEHIPVSQLHAAVDGYRALVRAFLGGRA
jgi:succinyl-diaminopimelate desuccinylase